MTRSHGRFGRRSRFASTLLVFASESITVAQSTRVSAPEAKTSTRPAPTHVALAVILQVRERASCRCCSWQRAKEPDARRVGPPGRLSRARRDARGVDPPAPRRQGRRARGLPPRAARDAERSRPVPARVAARDRVSRRSFRAASTRPCRRTRAGSRSTGCPRLAFDHGDDHARRRGSGCARKLSYTNIGFALAPPRRSRSVGAARHLRRGARARRFLRRTCSAYCCGAACSSRPASREPGPVRRPARGALPLPHARARDHRSVRGTAAAGTLSGATGRRSSGRPGACRRPRRGGRGPSASPRRAPHRRGRRAPPPSRARSSRRRPAETVWSPGIAARRRSTMSFAFSSRQPGSATLNSSPP